VVSKLVEAIEQRCCAFSLETGYEHLAVCIEAVFDDRGELFVGLAGCEDRLGHAGAAFTVHVEPCKTEIRHSRRSQAIDSLVNTELPGDDRFQNLLNFVPVQRSSIGIHVRSATVRRAESAVYRSAVNFSYNLDGVYSDLGEKSVSACRDPDQLSRRAIKRSRRSS